MAIVKMKKLRAIAAASCKEELMRELLLLGCVELNEQDYLLSDPETAALVSGVFGDVTAARTQRQLYADAIRILNAHVPVKSPMLAPKPQISQQALMDDERSEQLQNAAQSLLDMEERLRVMEVEISKERLIVESLQPWSKSDLPLDYAGTRHVAAMFGTVAAATDMDAFSAAVSAASEATEIIEISQDKNARYLLAFYVRADEEAVLSALRSFGFAPPTCGAVHGLARDGMAEAEKRIADLGTERIEIQARIAECGKLREEFRIAFDRASTNVGCEEETGKLLATESAILLEGWSVADKADEVAALLERMECAYEFTEPDESEYPDVPVQLKNNKFTEGLNMVTEMYSLPMYGSVDPNPIMAPFFILFYGIMMADMGYGLLMMLIGWLVMTKKRPKQGFLRYFGLMMIEGGFATFVIGLLTGGFFGDAPYYVVHLLNPESTWAGLPVIIDPLNDTVMVLIGAMVLGLIHLCYGMAVSFYMKTRDGDLIGALCEEGGTWALFLGAGLTLLGLGGNIPLYVGLACYAVGKMHSGKGIIGKVMAIFSGIYSDATGWFGDILSYARLMALMLAGGVTAQVFNRLGAMPGNIFVFLIICLVGNMLNFGLNLLGCYVHDLRLQCLEFFNKFYEAGGRPFKPLKIHSKYYNVTK